MSDRPPIRKKILAIDWDARHLRVVHAEMTKRGPRIDRLLSVAVPTGTDPTDAATMGKLIRRVLDQEGISTKYALVDIPRGQAILNTLSLPCQAPNELPGIVSIQVAKQLPVAVSDAVIDFAVAPHEPGAAMGDVLVAAVRREVVAQYESTFTEAGLKLERIGLRPYANLVAVKALLRHAMPDRVLVIDVGADHTEIDVVRNSFLAFSRAAEVAVGAPAAEPRAIQPPATNEALTLLPAVGEEQATGAAVPSFRLGAAGDDDISLLVVEVTRSLEAYRVSDPGAKIDHVVVGGDAGVEEALAESIQQRLGVSAEIYNPAATFGWEPDEGVSAAAFAATLGLVIGYAEEDALQFDFLHPKRSVSKTERRLKKAPIAAAVAVLFLVAGGVAIAQFTKPDRERLASIDRRIKESEAKKSEHEKFLSLVEEVRKFDSTKFVWIDVLYDIVSNLPPQEDLVLSQIDIDDATRRVQLKTKTKSRDTATDIISRLESYRRPDREKQRFKAGMRTQVEKPGEEYTFTQDIWVDVQDDEPKPKKGGGA